MTERRGKRSGLYKRISDDREGLELGVTRQEEDLRAAAERAGDEVVGVYSDNDRGASTRSKKPRPEYDRLLADAAAGRIEKIWAYTSSRLTRRPMEHEGQIQLAERHGVEFAYIRSPSFDLNTANGRMIARMLAAKDANEAEETSERIVRTFQQKRANGEYLGGRRMFGWESDGETLRPVEAMALAQASEDVVDGATLASIAARWNAAGMPTNRGNPWRFVGVRQVLWRARNAGLIEHQGEIVGRFPWYDRAPVSEDTWAAVRVELEDPGRRSSPGNRPRWLGSGLYVCWGCEQPALQVSMSRGPRAAGIPTYRCAKRYPAVEGRHHTARQTEALDAWVEHLIVERLSRPDAVDLARMDDAPSVDGPALRAERVAVRAKLDALDDDLDADRIDRPRWTRRNATLRDRLGEIDRLLVPGPSRSPLAGLVGAEDIAVAWYGTLPDRSDGAPLALRRAALADLMVVRVLPVRAKGAGFNPAAIEVDWLR